MGFFEMARAAKIDAERKKYGGARLPEIFDRVTLKHNEVTPWRAWQVLDVNEETGEILIAKPVYAGGGVYPLNKSNYGAVCREVTVEDIKEIYN